ncbi:MAG: hypothetical protein OHK0046_41910 [Anaerolineae bacterium]
MMRFKLLESVVRSAPLGLRFRDLVRNIDVVDGLIVTAWPFGKSEPRLSATRSPVSGIYGYASLPGLREYELGRLPATHWCNSNSLPNFVVSVEDSHGRFLPQVLPLCLPKPALVVIQLFSNPARPTPIGYAAVRGQLWDATRNAPACWGRISATLPDGKQYEAVADGRGAFVIFLPSPAPQDAANFEELVTPVADLTWPLTFRVAYQPTTHRWQGQIAPEQSLIFPEDEQKTRIPPDTLTILEQAEAVFAGGAATFTGTLAYRQDLILANCAQSEASGRLTRLCITAR